jgi:hypothetical protein
LAVVVASVLAAKGGFKNRLMAVPGLLMFTWVVLTLSLHLSQAEWLPSAAAIVTGPSTKVTDTSLRVDLPDGTIRVLSGSPGGAYRVAPLLRGGPAGAPEVLEQDEGASLNTVIVGRDDSQWFRFSGWSLELAVGPRWEVRIDADRIEADLRTLDAAAIELAAPDTTAVLGPVTRPATLLVEGTARIEVPPDLPVVVVGAAVVPDGWQAAGDGYKSPADGTGWTITLGDGAAATIVVNQPG